MSRSTAIIPLATLALLAVITVWLAALSGDSTRRSDTRNGAPDVVVEQFTARRLDDRGEVRFSLRAARLAHFGEDDSSELQQAEAIAYSAGGKYPPVNARAPMGRLVRPVGGEDLVLLSGEVRVQSDASARLPALQLTTPSLSIWPDRGQARADQGVKVVAGRDVMTAQSMELDANVRKMLLKDVSATLALVKPARSQ
jgi:lipopolysaccharide export system protein LptC